MQKPVVLLQECTYVTKTVKVLKLYYVTFTIAHDHDQSINKRNHSLLYMDIMILHCFTCCIKNTNLVVMNINEVTYISYNFFCFISKVFIIYKG